MIANIFKFIFGFFLAIAILIGGGVATALYFMNRTSINPPKPIYSNDQSEIKAKAAKEAAKATPDQKSPSSPATTASKPTPTPTPTPTKVTEELPPGAYTARVTWPQGLSIRTQPQAEAERAGGVGFNEEVIVLSQSNDGAWQKIRLKGSDQEGWVKTGNTQKTE